MPLCILEIPRVRYQAMPESRDDDAKNLCDAVLDCTIDGLNIPKKDDREARVAITDGESSRVSVLYTVGLHEYPNCEPESFFPTPEQTRSVCATIHSLATEYPFGVTETSMEAWSDTTFISRPSEPAEPVSSTQLEQFKEIGKYLDQPRMKLVLSPNKRRGISSSGKEGEPPREDDPYREVEKGISKLIAESLGLPERTEIQTELEYAHQADTDISVEVDFQLKPGHSITEEARGFIAREIEKYLNENTLTQEGTAEIWIRQGEPEIFTQTSAARVSQK